MARKFKILKAASRITPETIQNFKEFRAGDRKITREVNPALGPRKLVYIYPFGLPSDLDNHTPIDMSERAFLALANVVTNGLTVFNLTETSTGSGNPQPAYEPAKAVISIKGTKKGVDPISAVTGLPYSAYNTESFTFPFGQSAGAPTYYTEQAAAIASAVEAKAPKNSVTFKPERWRGN